MACVWLYDETKLEIEPADLKTDQRDIVLMLTTVAELARAGALNTPRPDHATCARLARLVAPYVTGATVDQIGDAFFVEPEAIIRVLRRVLLFFLYADHHMKE